MARMNRMRAVWVQRSGYRPINACSLRSPDRKQGQDRGILHYRNLFLIAPLASVVCDRLIANRSRSGDLDLQRGHSHGICYRHAGPYGPEAGCLFGCCAEPARRAAGSAVARLNVEDLCLGLPLRLFLQPLKSTFAILIC